MCDEAILIHDGRDRQSGDPGRGGPPLLPAELRGVRLGEGPGPGSPSRGCSAASPTPGSRTKRAQRNPQGFEHGGLDPLRAKLVADQEIPKPVFSFDICAKDGTRVFSTPLDPVAGEREVLAPGETVDYSAAVATRLAPGSYVVNCSFSQNEQVFDSWTSGGRSPSSSSGANHSSASSRWTGARRPGAGGRRRRGDQAMSADPAGGAAGNRSRAPGVRWRRAAVRLADVAARGHRLQDELLRYRVRLRVVPAAAPRCCSPSSTRCSCRVSGSGQGSTTGADRPAQHHALPVLQRGDEGGAVGCVVARENIVRKMQFPRLAIPLATVLTSVFNLLLNLVAVMIFYVATGIEPRLSWLSCR